MLSIEEVQNILRKEDEVDRLEGILNLGDRFELGSDRKQLRPDEWNSILNLLIEAAIQEQDTNLRSEIFWTIHQAIMFNPVAHNVDWDPLAAHLAVFTGDDLGAAISALGSSQKEKYLPVVSSYLTHADPEVVQEAKDAIHEIEWRKAQNALQKRS